MESNEIKKKVIEGYREIAENNPNRIVILDGSKDIEQLTDIAWNKIHTLLEKEGIEIAPEGNSESI